MALDKVALKSDLKTIFSNPATESNVDAVAEAIASAIDRFVKTGTVTGADSRGDTLVNTEIR